MPATWDCRNPNSTFLGAQAVASRPVRLPGRCHNPVVRGLVTAGEPKLRAPRARSVRGTRLSTCRLAGRFASSPKAGKHEGRVGSWARGGAGIQTLSESARKRGRRYWSGGICVVSFILGRPPCPTRGFFVVVSRSQACGLRVPCRGRQTDHCPVGSYLRREAR